MLFLHEELKQIVLNKGLFAPIKGQLFRQKGTLDYLEEQAEVKFLLTFDSNQETFIFSKEGIFFNEALHTWTPYFSKMVPEIMGFVKFQMIV